MTKKEIKPIDIVLVTFQRLNFLKYTIAKIYERTKYPYRLIVVDNGSTDGTQEWIKNAKVNGFIQEHVFLPDNKGLAYGLTEGFKRVKSDFFITTQDDIVPPDLNPCWLERMLHLAEKYPDYGGLAMRIQRIRHRDVDESKDLIDSPSSLASVLRIQKKKDIEAIGGFGVRQHWESTSFVRKMMPIKKKFAFTTHLYANHIGFMVENKGFKKGFVDYYTYAEERVSQGKEQPYPYIDDKTNIPIKINTPRDNKEHKKRQDYWDYWGKDPRRTHRLQQDQFELAEYAKNGKGIDIGCGRVKCHKNAIGVDVYPFPCVDVLANAEDLWMFEDDSLDFVVASHALEHFPDTKSVLKEWKRVLKRGGVIAVAVPDGEKRPNSIKGSHKVALTKEVLRIIFKFELGMQVLKAYDVPNKKVGKESIVVVARKR